MSTLATMAPEFVLLMLQMRWSRGAKFVRQSSGLFVAFFGKLETVLVGLHVLSSPKERPDSGEVALAAELEARYGQDDELDARVITPMYCSADRRFRGWEDAVLDFARIICHALG